MTTKRRQELQDSTLFTIVTYPTGGGSPSVATTKGVFVGHQTTVSYGHKWPPRRGQKTVDSGGSFVSQKVEWRNNPARVDYWSKSRIYHTTGPVYPWYYSVIGSSADYVAASSDSQMDAYGTILISRALPTNPLSGLGQFLGELKKDGIPSIPFSDWKKKARKFKSLARHGSNEYLNVQFGWMPFIKDIIDVFTTFRDRAKIIKQYSQGSGKPQKRRRSFPQTRSTTVSTIATSHPGVPQLLFGSYKSYGTVTKHVDTTSDIWFSGSFTYFLPEAKTALGKAMRMEAYANKLFGLRITPDLLWKLAPWSWAIDWVTSTGAVIRNWSAFATGELVMNYGYVMETKRVVTTYTLVGASLSDGQSLDSSQMKICTTKCRRRATPFGFGLNPQSFSAFQWSIVAALGISKAPRSLAF